MLILRSIPIDLEYVVASESNESVNPEDDSTAPLEESASASETPEVETPEVEVPELSELETATAACEKLKEQLLRTSADFENYRKRSRRDVEEARRRAKEDVLREVLLVIDNLERAVEASAAATDAKQVAEGVEMVLRGFDEVCSRVNMSRQSVLGEAFDPALHDAVQQLESPEYPLGTVSAQVRAGYMLDEKLLRPAMVVVSKGPAGGAAEAAEPDPTTEKES